MDVCKRLDIAFLPLRGLLLVLVPLEGVDGAEGERR